MRNIKLAVLGLTLICGALGAYGKYKNAFQIYNVVGGASTGALSFTIAANPPSMDCGPGAFGYVCTISAEAGLPNGAVVASHDATIITVYQ